MAEADGPLAPDRPLPQHMAALASQGSTGILVATSQGVQREIMLVEGEIRAARSSDEGEKLGMWLVQRKRISDSERALTLLAQGGVQAPPLGHLLVTRGCIDQETLEAELEELALTIIRRAAGHPETTCGFLEGSSPDQPDTLPNLTTPQIILIATREYSGQDAKRSAVGPLDQMVWPSSRMDLLADINLSPAEAFLLSRLDGARKISNLISVSALPLDQAVSTLYSLMVSGLVEVGRPEEQPRPTLHDETVTDPLEEAVPIVDEDSLTQAQLEERHHIRQLAGKVTEVDHYGALGLRPEASAATIDEAWSSIEKRYDPERASSPHLADLATALSAIVERALTAHSVLSRPSTRRRYDEILRSVQAEQESLGSVGKQRKKVSEEARRELVAANFKRADELIREGEPYLAIRLLEQACSIDPRPAQLVKLARLLMRNPLWTNRALAQLRKAIEVDQRYVDAWIELAEFWRRRSNGERQRKALERALAADPQDERARSMYQQLVGRRELERLLKRARPRSK